MPALKMKAKSSTASVKEVSCLHVTWKSSKKSKTSGSAVRLCHEMAELDTSSQNCENVSSKVESSAMEDGSNEVFHKMFHDEEYPSFQKRFSSVQDSISLKRMDLPPFPCSIDSEAIFSPFIDVGGVHLNSIAQGHEGCEDGSAVPEVTAGDYDSWIGMSSSCQSSNASDSYISDMSVPVSMDVIGGLDDILTDYLFSESDYVAQSLMLDTTECMKLPALVEEPVETKNIHLPRSCEELSENSEYSWFHQVSHQIKPDDQELDVNSNSADLNEADFDPQLFIRNFLDLSDMEPDLFPSLMPKETSQRTHITLVLDLDETLVHSTMEPCSDADFTFQVPFDMKEHTVYVRQRPFLRTFLERVAEMFEVVVFTASQSIYAEQLLDILDPDRKIIARRLFRESCTFSDGSYTKDLTVVGVDLAKIAIIDNSPQVFQLQVDNGIPIKSWFDDPSDRALISLIPFLETLANADDVRPIIAKKYGIKESHFPSDSRQLKKVDH